MHRRSVAKYGEDVLKKAAMDVAIGRTIMFPVTQAQEIRGLRISLIEEVEEKERLRAIHDLIRFRLTVREARETGRRKHIYVCP